MMRNGQGIMGRLGELVTPTLIVTGEVDMLDVHAHAGALQALIPGARRIVISDSGHLVYLEHPEAFVDVITTFLKTPARTSGS
jgi:3-oxoadipate enol-lactonase